MEIEEVFEILESTDEEMAAVAGNNHPLPIHLVRSGIGLILDAIYIVGEGKLDLDNVQEYILKRYLYVIPFRAKWALKSLLAGYPSTSFSLLRILLEEFISMHYFLTNPDAAKSALVDDKYIEPKLNKKLAKLTKNPDFLRIAGALSDGYVHPSIKNGFFTRADDGVVPEPYYDKGKTDFGFDILVFIVEGSVQTTSLFNLDIPAFHAWRDTANAYFKDTGAYKRDRAESSKLA